MTFGIGGAKVSPRQGSHFFKTKGRGTGLGRVFFKLKLDDYDHAFGFKNEFQLRFAEGNRGGTRESRETKERKREIGF
jgi:hypothetical protein